MKALFDSVDQLQATMTFHRERHSVLAGNVANLDTPGYRPLDLERVDSSAPGSLPLAATDDQHLQAGGGTSGGVVSFSDGDVTGADGNAVSLERELAKIDANRVRYHTSVELASRRLALIRYTAGDGA